DTWAARTLTAPAAGFTITNPAGTAGNPTFVLANDLSAVEGLAGTGFAVRTAADTWTNRTLVAGTGVSITNADGVAGNPTITNTVSATTPGGVNTNVQFNNLGAFGGTSNFNFVSATPRVTITGTGNILFVGDDTVGPAQAGVAKVTIKTDFGVDAEALRIYLNRDLSDNNAWLTFLYDATTDAPLLRLIDEDDDPPAITFDTIDVLGGGTFAAPNISNRFGSRGTIGAVTTGFSWKVNGTEIATMDTQFLEIPGGTTALRPSPASDGMIRFNTSLPAPETFFQADWHPFGAHGGAGYSFLFDDFLSEVSITTSFSTLGWAANLTGTGTALADVNTGINSTDGAFGVIQLATGTTTTGRVGMSLGALNLVFGYGQHIQEWRIQVPTLSTAAEEFLSYVGFTDNYAIAGDVVDGIYFQYDRLTSANWRICTANNSTRTKTTTSTAVTAGTWIKLGIVVNAAGTSVEFFINGVSVGTTTTNIPTAAGRDTGMGCKIEKTAGTTSRTFLVDYFKNHTFFTTAR
ncbi:MAG: hypothetical protein ACREAU_05365, partial [Nitrosopumilaceae archaeon]